MRRRNIVRLSIIILLIALAAWVVGSESIHLSLGSERLDREGMKFGLDLQGGIHLIYQADFSGVDDADKASRLQGAIDTIRRRIDAYGVTEPVIQQLDEDRILVQLPGVTNIDEAMILIGQTAQLDFRELALFGEEWNTTLTAPADVGDTELAVTDVTNFVVGRNCQIGAEIRRITAVDQENKQITVSPGIEEEHEIEEVVRGVVIEWVPAMAEDSQGELRHLTGEYFKATATAFLNPQNNQPEVAFELKEEGPGLFKQITTRLLHQPLGIFLDDELISAPVVRAVLENGGVITGLNWSRAKTLAIQLNQGILPVKLLGPDPRYLVDASLGADSLNRSIIAGVSGLGIVLLFMIIYYRLPGLLASCALLIYVLLAVSVFKLVPVTLTLAGIAGFILSIGMAVDANVLIFERMKEEFRAGRTLGAAIETGFNRAWPSIRDSNISTFITCGILYWFGSNFGETRIMGFALTLGIGVAISMFTAIFITRSFLRGFIGTKFATRLSLFSAVGQGMSVSKEDYDV